MWVRRMVVKLATMNAHEIDTLLREQILCRIAFQDATYPYIAPFQYAYLNDTLYFHFTNYGKKLRLLERDNHVCVEIERIQPDLREYDFVSLRGTLHPVHDPAERRVVIQQMADEGRHRLSTNFLAAHGLAPAAGWSSFTPENPLLILKLDILERIGLKSP